MQENCTFRSLLEVYGHIRLLSFSFNCDGCKTKFCDKAVNIGKLSSLAEQSYHTNVRWFGEYSLHNYDD
jgi:hypothetical protein